MTALLLLAALAPDAAMDAYTRCAQATAASATEAEAYARIEADCAAEQAAVLESAPDEEAARQRLYVAATVAVAGRGARPPAAETTPAAQPASPKLEAYRMCGLEQAAQAEARRPYFTAEAIATEATARCEKLLKPAAGETAAEMRQPGLRGQVMLDFRRRSISDLTRKIGELRAEKGAK